MKKTIRSRPGKTLSLLICAAGYLVALTAAILAGYLVRNLHPLLVVLIADVTGTIVIFLFSLLFDNSSFYDPYWSVAPVAILFYLLSLPAADAVPVFRKLLVYGLTAVWAVRLTWNWIRRWKGLSDEDWRYAGFRKTGIWYWPVSFLGFHFFPTLTVFLGCLSLYGVLTSATGPLHLFDLLACAVTLTAILIEALADRQLRNFKLKKKKIKTVILDSGLWRYSRHPNYFGEVLFWWGLFLFSLTCPLPTILYALAGPAAMTLLFVFISVPMADRRMLLNRPAFRIRLKRVSGLVPLPVRKIPSTKRRS